MAKQTYSVLLADDSEDDRLFLRLAISRNPRLTIVGEVGDGEDAISYLAGHGDFENRERHPFPDLLLLDLKMPKKDGHEVLAWLNQQPFEGLFVAVVSGSFLVQDVQRSMALGAHAYYKKNALKEEQEAMIQQLMIALDDGTLAKKLPPQRSLGARKENL
jgi:CheY-like chemotaxis protein